MSLITNVMWAATQENFLRLQIVLGFINLPVTHTSADTEFATALPLKM